MSEPQHHTDAFGARVLEAMLHAPNYHRWILDEFRPFLGQRVLEVGAGCGSLARLILDLAPPQQFTALEPSRVMFERLRRELGNTPGVTLHNARLAEMLPECDDGVDTILYVNVLEHITEDREEMQNARRMLVPGGHLCVFVPALPWLYSEFDAWVGHARRYARSDLTRLVREAGFEVVRVRHFDLAGVLPWIIAVKWLRLPLSPGMARLFDSVVVPVMRRVEAAVPPPTGKNLVLVARRPAE